MAAQPQTSEHNAVELREMDDETARNTLTVAEYERRERIINAYEQAEATREERTEQERRVQDIVVHADTDALVTEVDIFGNDVGGRINPEDDALRELAVTMEEEYGDIDPERIGEESIEGVDDAAVEEIVADLIDLLDIIIVRWNGTAWADLDAAHRRAILEDAREAWGLDGFFVALLELVEAIEADQEERFEVVDGFR
jgi:hypothetical protein